MQKADEEKKKGAQSENLLSKEETYIEINHQVLCDMQKANTQTERPMWQNQGAIYYAQSDLYE